MTRVKYWYAAKSPLLQSCMVTWIRSREICICSAVQTWREIRTEVRLYDFLDPGWFQPSPWGEGWNQPGAKFQPGSSAVRHVNAPFTLCTWGVEIWPGSNSTRVETLHVNTAWAPMARSSSSSSSRFYYFTRGIPTGVAFLLGTLGEFLRLVGAASSKRSTWPNSLHLASLMIWLTGRDSVRLYREVFFIMSGYLIPRVDKQECATPDLSYTICRYPAPTAEFFVYVTFFQRNAALPQSSVRARAGHRPCSVKPSQVHEGNLSKRLAARASSKRLRQQKIPPWANPPASCTLLFIYSC